MVGVAYQKHTLPSRFIFVVMCAYLLITSTVPSKRRQYGCFNDLVRV